jgi:hypothetical protein
MRLLKPCNVLRRAAFAEEAECYARECIRLAGLTADEEARAMLVEMAREWMNVAIEAEGGTPIPPSTPASGLPDKS